MKRGWLPVSASQEEEFSKTFFRAWASELDLALNSVWSNFVGFYLEGSGGERMLESPHTRLVVNEMV